MKDMEILGLANKCNVIAVSKHEWDGKRFNHIDDLLEGDGAGLIQFARLLMAIEREACAELAEEMERIRFDSVGDPRIKAFESQIAKAIRARGEL